MDLKLRVLRRVEGLDPNTMAGLKQQTLDIARLYEKNNPETFAQHMRMYVLGDEGWFDTDFPHDWEVSEELVAHTKEYALAGPEGTIMAKFATIVEANTARDSAKISYKVDVQLPEVAEE